MSSTLWQLLDRRYAREGYFDVDSERKFVIVDTYVKPHTVLTFDSAADAEAFINKQNREGIAASAAQDKR